MEIRDYRDLPGSVIVAGSSLVAAGGRGSPEHADSRSSPGAAGNRPAQLQLVGVEQLGSPPGAAWVAAERGLGEQRRRTAWVSRTTGIWS